MRGKVRGKNGSVHGFGITPAYAGKSFSDFFNAFSVEDHPPPMRGKAFSSFASGMNTGITPAYAGKRNPSWA